MAPASESSKTYREGRSVKSPERREDRSENVSGVERKQSAARVIRDVEEKGIPDGARRDRSADNRDLQLCRPIIAVRLLEKHGEHPCR